MVQGTSMRNQVTTPTVESVSTTFLCGIDQEQLKSISVDSGSASIGLELGKSVGNIGISITNGQWPTSDLSAQAQDLIEIAAYLYQSDRLVARNMDAWTRHLDYHV